VSKFHSLPVAKVERETRDAICVTFDVPDALRDLFRFEPGQHLTLRTRIKRLARKTICFSKSVFMHDTVIGLFVNRYEFGSPI